VLTFVELDDPRRLTAALQDAVDGASLSRRHDIGQLHVGRLGVEGAHE
jgi:hypothetical protein